MNEWDASYDEMLGEGWEDREEARASDFEPYSETALKEERAGILFGELEEATWH